MISLRLTLFQVWICCTPFFALAQTQNLDQEITGLLSKYGLKEQSYSLRFVKSQNSQVLFEKNSANKINPASSIKVLTSLVALDQLGPSHRFITTAYKKGNDVCILGGGDPSMVQEQMWLLSEKLWGHLPKINTLFLDDSLFPASRDYAKDFSGDSHRAFTAPVGALSINHNSVSVYVEGQAHGQKPVVRISPSLPSFIVSNQSHSKTSSRGKNIHADIIEKNQQWEIKVSGSIQPNQSFTLYRSIDKPLQYFGSMLSHYYQLHGGKIAQGFSPGLCDPQSEKLFEFRSKPLSLIVHGMNKYSSNFYAETLAHHLSKALSRESGIEALAQWAQKHIPESSEMVLQSASGLSRGTRVSAAFMTDVLAYAQSQFSISPEWVSSLSIYGEDGTLRRFKDPLLRSKVRAKSGSLQDVVSLVGIIDSPKHGEVNFAMLFMQGKKATWEIQQLEELILRAMM